MSRFQSWMATFACVGMLIAPAAESRAAEPPVGTQQAAGARHLDLAFIPAEAVSAIVVHPQAFLTGPESEWMPVEVITAAGMKEAGFDPVKISEGVALFAPPTQGSDPEFGAILRFSEAYSKDSVMSRFPGRKQSTSNGIAVIEIGGPQDFWLGFPDEKTLIAGSSPLVKKMLAAKDADSPLIGLLKTADVAGHLTAVFSIDAVRPIMKRAIASVPPVPPQFQDFLKVPDLLSAIILKVEAGEKFKASLTLRARDAASAEETERIVNMGLAMGRMMVFAQLAQAPASDPIEQASKKYATRIINRMFEMIKPVRDGQDVSIKVETGSSVATVGILVALLLPAVQAAREAANRNTSLNKLRQIGLALENYESGHKHFPAHAIFSKDGKPLLSWRVAILPQLEEVELYKQFHLDEPWDSEHNKPLIAKMPFAYLKPGQTNDGTTVFLVPVGKGLAFEGTEGLKHSDFTDGTSKTILAVEANDDRAVPWTKPDDLEIDMNKPFEGLFKAEAGGMSCFVFVDNHTIGITDQCDLETFKALLTRNGGEPIDDTLIH